MASLVVRIPWSVLRGTGTGVQEFSIETPEDTPEGKTTVETLKEKVKPTIRRMVESLVDRHAFSNEGEFRDLVIGTIEFLVVTEKRFESLDSLEIKDVYDQAILKRLREISHRKEY